MMVRVRDATEDSDGYPLMPFVVSFMALKISALKQDGVQQSSRSCSMLPELQVKCC